ncbi:MAG: imidazole glycerol phosphate synthase subunit HisF [Flavobacteriaceae bacterium]|nr:imidazole glycerol phosphate synthase subunit HisF [Flavobacteriaceae bacterium]
MNKTRIIARLDVKNDFVIKGIHLEGLRKVGDPNAMAKKYYNQGIDEIIFMDAVAAYYDRNSLTHIIEKACRDVFVPITVGGGIRKIEDIQIALNAGADKTAINTKAVQNPNFIKEASEVFGSQCIVSSIDAKKKVDGQWEVYVDNGREPTGIDVLEWVKEVESLGAGEIMITSIDKEGTKKGFDIELNELVSSIVSIPVISSGGAGKKEHVSEVIKSTNVDAVSIASLFHYGIAPVDSLKEFLVNEQKIDIRL